MILFISSQAVNADFISGKCCKTTSQSQCSMDHKTNCRLFMNIITSFFFFFSDPIYIHSTIPNMPKPSTPLLNQRKKQDLETKEKNDQAKPGKLKEDFKPSSVYFCI